MSPNLPTFHITCSSRVTAVVGGNFQATAQRGSRPTEPRRRCSSRSSTFTTAPSISKSSSPRRRSHSRHWPTTSSSPVSTWMPRLTRKPWSRSHCRASRVRLEGEALGHAHLVAPDRQRPLGGVGRVELADRAGGRVARVHERRLACFGAALVQRGEVRQRHVHLAAHLHQRRRVVDVQGDRADRAQVVRDVLADLPVPARGAALEQAVAVDEADRQPVDLRLDDEPEGRLGDALAREVGAHPLDPGAELLLGAHVAEREHRLEMLDLLQTPHRLPSDAPRRRVGARELRVLGLQTAQLVEQAVVLVVADLRVVEHVVAVGMVLEQRAQLGGPLARLGGRRGGLCSAPGGAHGIGSCAARSAIGGASSSCMSKRRSASRLGRSVRSKWIGVTAMRPAATAARSVPGSSWKPGSEP